MVKLTVYANVVRAKTPNVVVQLSGNSLDVEEAYNSEYLHYVKQVLRQDVIYACACHVSDSVELCLSWYG